MRLRLWSVVVLLLVASIIMIQAQEGEVPDLPLSNDFLYTVEAGDTIDSVAALFDVDVDCLLETNELNESDTVIAGDLLLISVACPAYNGSLAVPFPRTDAPTSDGDAVTEEEPAEEAEPLGETEETPPVQVIGEPEIDDTEQTVVPGGTYTIQRGDTLDTIGQAFDLSVEQLRQFNDIQRGDILQIGDVLNIPADPLPYGVFPPTADEDAGEIGGGVAGEIYVIQPGDTLDTIAQEFNVSLVQLEIVNDLENQVIFPGQQIVIPEDAVPYGVFPPIADPEAGEIGGGVAGEIYVIQPNDTLDTIAQDFDVSLVQLQQVNDIPPGQRIFPGQQIVIPEDAVPYGVFPPLSTGSEQGGGISGESYVIQPGDTLDQVAQEFDVSTTCLIESNNITNTRNIQPGTEIGIPSSCPPYSSVVVPTGEIGTDDTDSDDDLPEDEAAG